MNDYNLFLLKEDIDNLVKIVSRLNKYMKMNEVIKLISERSLNEDIGKKQISKSNNTGITITDKVLSAIKDAQQKKDKFFHEDIFEFFINNNLEKMAEMDDAQLTKTKKRIRDIMSSLKQRKKIEGNAKEGFKILEEREAKELEEGKFF